MKTDDLQFILDTYGLKHQSMKCIEEMSELTKALCKWWDEPLPKGDTISSLNMRDSIIDELADVQITINQIILGFNVADRVERQIDYKIQRQMDRIGKTRWKDDPMEDDGK